jgi:cholesterol oxidase
MPHRLSRRDFLRAGAGLGVGLSAAGTASAAADRASPIPSCPAPAVSRGGHDFDAIVVGSGFGGAVAACRLAENGFKVLVLERGRRWKSQYFPGKGTNFPRRPEDPFLWSQTGPETNNGWFDIRLFDRMVVVTAAGVGGGSLAYSNVSVEAAEGAFKEGWPKEIRFDELQRYYQTVGEMLDVQPLPDNQLTERFKLLREGANKTGYDRLFHSLPLAVTFDKNFLPEPHPGGLSRSVDHSKRFKNRFGVEQGYCVHLGTCNIGCDAMARNTLDVNYLARAQSCGAEIRPLHLVRRLTPAGDGYRASFDRILPGERLEAGEVTAKVVVLAAGSLGSTELLLRCRDEFRTLPNLSQFLGHHWSTNANFLTPAIHPGRVSPTQGPTISAAIDLNTELYKGESIHIEDGGFPDVLGNWLRLYPGGSTKDMAVRLGLRLLRADLADADRDRDVNDPYRYMMPWFAQGRDHGEGVLRLRRGILGLGRRRLDLDWRIEDSKSTFDRILELHERLAQSTGGAPKPASGWTDRQSLATPHPLGGCAMGDAPGQGRTWTDHAGFARRTDEGVVDHKGEVFGHPNLYVADGSIFPRSIGRNPSRTIAALAERIAAHIVTSARA